MQPNSPYTIVLLECGWVLPFVVACSYHAKPKTKDPRVSYVSTSYSFTHHQISLAWDVNSMKQCEKELEDIIWQTDWSHPAHIFIACMCTKEKISFLFFAHHDQYKTILLSTYEFKIKIAVSIFVNSAFPLSSTKTIHYNEELCHL